jgi:2-methylfumaryl-CoA isomerase
VNDVPLPLGQDGGVDAPLHGMQLIELSSYIASPLGGMILAQLGADVIRVDPIGGSADQTRWPITPTGRSIYWAELNRGKRSVTVDTASPEGRALISDLVVANGPAGGILLTNAQPRSGLRYADLRSRRADVLFVQLQGKRNGETAVDYIVNASLGFPMITGPVDHIGPVNHALPAWDVACGLYLAIGLLTADRRRRLTGQGQSLSVALEDVALALTGNLGYLAQAELDRAPRPRVGNYIYGTFGRDFQTSDDRYVMITVLTTRHWRDLVSVTGLAKQVDALEIQLGTDFSREGQRFIHRDALAALLIPWFAARDSRVIAQLLHGRSLLWSMYATFADLVHDEGGAFRMHPGVRELDQPGIGSYHAMGSPLVFDGRAEPAVPAPTLGEHTDGVLREVLSLTPDRISDLRRRRVIGEPDT